ncbi:MAG: hypothetical protein GAK31_00300 [Stenotrophomonas maltophilia]|uniref:Carboxypeptidase regulatory-like domain-containing protein n=1 Tax=Stenotrophomonas maltophilia TaxID=40324 RepID=A0A7V8FJ82_STEMA|nr:MAG: hypothetical protein GAK31_00300 [Stenotrophomonas maltophilia]
MNRIPTHRSLLARALLPLVLLCTGGLASAATAPAHPEGHVQGRAKAREQLYLINKASGSIIGLVADARGRFVSGAVPAGQYEVTTQGGLACSVRVDVVAGATAQVDLTDCPAH